LLPLASCGVHRVDELVTALPLIPHLKAFFVSEWRMDKEACATSAFEHGTVAGVLWQKGTLRFAARSQANSGPERVGKKPYFHLRSIAPWTTRCSTRASSSLDQWG
jgi:hypothetical protein